MQSEWTAGHSLSWATRSFSGIKRLGAKEFVGGTVMAEAAVSLEIPVVQ